MAVTHRDCSAQNSIVTSKMDRTVDTDKLSAALCNFITTQQYPSSREVPWMDVITSLQSGREPFASKCGIGSSSPAPH